MIEFIALFLVILFYVIPLNIVLYNICESFSEYLLNNYPNPPFKFLLYISSDYLPPTIYVVTFIIIFLLLYFLLSSVVRKSLFIFKDIDISKYTIIKYSKGQKSMNIIARILIIALLVLQWYVEVINIRIIVLGVLCFVFIFKELKPRKIRKTIENAASYKERTTKKELVVDDSESYIDFKWTYELDALDIKKPIEFNIRFDKKANYMVKDKATMLEIEKNVRDFSAKVKNLCDYNNLDNFHKIYAVYSLLSKFKIENSIENSERTNQTPSETLAKQAGNDYSIGICASTILRAMTMEVKELEIPSKDGGTKLALAVEGADELVGNYYVSDNKQYFYCQLGENNDFIVGEVPKA
ncbi:hypothetical protein [Clostridium manihotivorum]|uniref:Uncharacterized protein n=1 Tax=Clostridium manihotivorum TaxID=2320868 RepID=A0A410DVK0_9CLOT|nr:hypothetical protein [Clostridium manihotivorum]QAA33008.1 hypothetical protein C1I91_15930 [Clostridium manihotivorum]